MAIRPVTRVKVSSNGNPASATIEKFGGKIYGVNFQRSYGEEASKCTLNFISASGEYDISENDLQVSTPTYIHFGGFIVPMYPVAYSYRRSVSGGRTLEVNFVDTSIILDKRFVGLPYVHGGVPEANIHVLIPLKREVDTDPGEVNDRRMRLILQYETTGVPEYNEGGYLIGDNYWVAANILRSQLEETTGEYDYNLWHLILEMKIKGIETELHGINVRQFDFYFVTYADNLRTVLSQILGDLGLGFYWHNNRVHLVDLASATNLTDLQDYIDTLNLQTATSQDESVSIEDTLCRVANGFYKQAGGRSFDSSSTRRKLVYSVLPPEELGYEDVPASVSINNGVLTIEKSSLRKFLVVLLNRIVGGSNKFAAWEYIKHIVGPGEDQDGDLVEIFFKSEEEVTDEEHIKGAYASAGISDDVQAQFWKMQKQDDENEFTLDQNQNITVLGLNYVLAYGRFYYRKGKYYQKGQLQGNFYHSELEIAEIPELAEVAVNQQWLETGGPGSSPPTVESVFETLPNSNLEVLNAKICPDDSLNGVYIIDAGNPNWEYKVDDDTKLKFKSLEDLVKVADIYKELRKLDLFGETSYPPSESGSVYWNENVDTVFRMRKTAEGFVQPDLAWLRKVQYVGRKKQTYSLEVEGADFSVQTFWPKKELNFNTSICLPNNKIVKLEFNNQEVSPDDIIYDRNTVASGDDANRILHALTDEELRDAIESVMTNRYGSTDFVKDSASASISVQTSEFTVDASTDQFLKFASGLQASMSDSGSQISYSFTTRIQKIPSPEVFKQKYLSVVVPPLAARFGTVVFSNAGNPTSKGICVS
jgi:hypothetical protein